MACWIDGAEELVRKRTGDLILDLGIKVGVFLQPAVEGPGAQLTDAAKAGGVGL